MNDGWIPWKWIVCGCAERVQEPDPQQVALVGAQRRAGHATVVRPAGVGDAGRDLELLVVRDQLPLAEDAAARQPRVRPQSKSRTISLRVEAVDRRVDDPGACETGVCRAAVCAGVCSGVSCSVALHLAARVAGGRKAHTGGTGDHGGAEQAQGAAPRQFLVVACHSDLLKERIYLDTKLFSVTLNSMAMNRQARATGRR